MLIAFLWLQVLIKTIEIYCECQCLWYHETEWFHHETDDG